MTPEGNLTTGVLVATLMVVVGMTAGWGNRRPAMGLTGVYLLLTWVTHVPGAIAYMVPWSTLPDPAATATGFHWCWVGMTSFLAGSLILGRLLMHTAQGGGIAATPMAGWRKWPAFYLILGLLIMVGVGSLLAGVPSISAVLGAVSNLLVVGLIMLVWRAGKEQGRMKMLAVASWALLVPVFGVGTSGFLSFGAATLAIVIGVVAQFYRPRWAVWLALPVVFYLGLSVFVTYTRDKVAIREVVWFGDSQMKKIARVIETFSDFELVDLRNPDHLGYLDARLNQNFLIGLAVHRLQSGEMDYLRGASLLNALAAPVPRVLWPNKPVVAGGMGLAGEWTGMTFAEGTSVGLGHVMELYVNFGHFGVVLGFALLGGMLRWLDFQGARRLLAGDYSGAMFFMLLGIPFLNVGGGSIELFGSCAAGLVLAVALRKGESFIFRVLGVSPVSVRRQADQDKQSEAWKAPRPSPPAAATGKPD